MINKLLQMVAPHHCCSCGKTGSALCDNCKYDIIDEPFDGCIVCAAPTATGICSGCHTTYEKAWCVGDRIGSLEAVINMVKFERLKDGTNVLASLLDDRLPVLPSSAVLVPIPTIAAHIRRRGYDHTLLIAKELARRRDLSLMQALRRVTNTQQRGQTKAARLTQAQHTFSCTETLSSDAVYILVDDVTTTNATLRYAAEALKNAGAETVWVAVVARQPLNKK